jgi:hypothetical protein
MKLMKPEKILDFIEKWPEHIAKIDHQNGRPLAYVTRKETIPPLQGIDPAFGEQDSMYGSLRNETLHRAPHGTPDFHVYNASVFDMLNDAPSDHKNVKTWIKAYAKANHGRAAWEAFKSHFFGTNQMEAIEAAAEKHPKTLVYHGEKARHTFEAHVSKNLRAHLDTTQSGGEIKEKVKVRKMLESNASFLANGSCRPARSKEMMPYSKLSIKP